MNGSALIKSGVYQSDNASSPGTINILSNQSTVSYPYTSSPSPVQAGALLSFSFPSSVEQRSVLVRFGVSFIDTSQACLNAEEEVDNWDWASVQRASENKWEDVLSRIEVDTTKENATVVELLYSSVSPYTLWYSSTLIPSMG